MTNSNLINTFLPDTILDLSNFDTTNASLIFTPGTEGDDLIIGTDISDIISGLGGNDLIFGNNLNDFISGGDGDDTIVGGKGNDDIEGNDGNDTIIWNNGDGSDTVDGGSIADLDRQIVNFDTDGVTRGLANDDVGRIESFGVSAFNFARVEVNGQSQFGLFSIEARDVETLEVNYGAGDDTMQFAGNVLNELVIPRANGNFSFAVDVSLDLDGGVGIDTLDFSDSGVGVDVNLGNGSFGSGVSSMINFENAIGTDEVDAITGSNADNVLSGGGGNDRLVGKGGDDTIIGNKGNDRMIGGAGNDLLQWNNGDGSDFMKGGAGYDKVQVNFNTDLVNEDLDNDDTASFAVSERGVEFARTEVNGQSQFGLFQLDIRETELLETNFGDGDDTADIIGTVFDEIGLSLNGGAGIDTLDLSQAEPRQDVDLSDGIAGTAIVSGFENVVGTSGRDRIKGDREDNTISGGNGNDRLLGLNGDDTIIGNKGNDRMLGGNGDDLLIWNNGDGSDLINGGRDYDTAQINFNTDLVNDDLQNDDVAEFDVSDKGVSFARTAVNGQSQFGLFELDIRNTEVLDVNFGGGDDTAVLKGDILDQIKMDLDGGDGVDTLDFSGLSEGIGFNTAFGFFFDPTVLVNFASDFAQNFEIVIGSEFDDLIVGDSQDNVISGLGGVDSIFGGAGDDVLVANKGNDFVFGGQDDDLIVWNNGDGSDFFDGGDDDDRVQVNFDTDLVNTDLQNKDVAEFSVTSEGVQFARIEVNDQSEFGLFALDIRNTETLETNFGGGDDVAVIQGRALAEIALELDGGDGADTLDLSGIGERIGANLETGEIFVDGGTASAVNFENVIGTVGNDRITGNDADNVIAAGGGTNLLSGGAGADSFVFFEGENAFNIIEDFELGVDRLVFATTDDSVTADSLLANLTQSGDDVVLATASNSVTFEDADVAGFTAESFLVDEFLI